jgi:outer membrane receptor for ferrienterochelin and colicins
MFYRTHITQFRLNLKTTFLFQLSVAVCLFTFILFVAPASLAAESPLAAKSLLSKLSVAEMSSIDYQASATENSPLFLDAMVITGSRTLKPLADTPVRTLVMDSDSIQKLHSRDIRDALRMLPGVQLREIHGKTGEEVMLQGFDGNRVLILVDGLPVSATTASTVDTSQLSALDIEQIEVIPGAGSALYGSAAMGGVINIVTKKTPNNAGGRISFQAGTFGSDRELSSELLPQRHLLAAGHVNAGAVKLSASVDRRESSEFDLDFNSYATNGYDGTKTQWKLGVESADDNSLIKGVQRHAWQFDTELYQEDLVNRRITTAGYAGKKEEDLDRHRFSFTGQLGINTTSWSYALLHEGQEDDTAQLNDDASILVGNLWRETDYAQQKAMLQANQPLYKQGQYNVELTSGLELFHEEIQQNKREIKLSNDGAESATELPSGVFQIDNGELSDASRYSTEIFTQLLASKTNSNGIAFELSPGARLQVDSDFGSYLAPALASRQRWPLTLDGWEIQTRQSISAGYRVPNLKDRYYLFDHSVNGYKVEGNPDLTPEASRSTQLSIAFTNNNDWHIEASLFHNRISDLIEAAHTGEYEDNGRVAIYRYTNISNALTRGYELALQNELFTGLRQRLSYSYLDARNLDTNKPLEKRAGQHIKGFWTWQVTDPWDITLTGEYQADYVTNVDETGNDHIESPDFARWDLKSGYQITLDVLVFGGINNLTDTVRDPSDSNDGRPSEGRFPYVGMDIRF